MKTEFDDFKRHFLKIYNLYTIHQIMKRFKAW